MSLRRAATAPRTTSPACSCAREGHGPTPPRQDIGDIIPKADVGVDEQYSTGRAVGTIAAAY
jgi:hypothetical protein